MPTIYAQELELVVPVRRKLPIPRHRAYEEGKPLPLVIAAIPIIGTDRIVELHRSPSKRVMGGQWIFFLSEHQQPADKCPRNALLRGFREELSYSIDEKTLFDPEEHHPLHYQKGRSEQRLSWRTRLYVVPIKRLSDLNPDGNEIIDVRERKIDDVMEDVYRQGSPYKRFNPEEFFHILERHTREVISR